MRFRGKSIRRKIVALLLVPLVSLTALWGFSTLVTGREASELLDASSVVDEVGHPVSDVLDALQQERRQTVVYLADRRSSEALPVLQKKRAVTDMLIKEAQRSAVNAGNSGKVRDDAQRWLTTFVDGLDQLVTLRHSVETASVSRIEALEFYSKIIDPGYSLLSLLHTLSDAGMDREGRGIVGLARAEEMLAREDALVVSAYTSGKLGAEDIRRIADMIAGRKLHYELSLEALPDHEREVFDQFWSSSETAPLREAEARLVSGGPVSRTGDTEVREWQRIATPVLDELRSESIFAIERHQGRIDPAARNVFLQAGIAGVLGFLALLVSIIVSVRIGRDLIRDITHLRKEAHEVSGIRLPSVMRRLAAGEQVDVESEAPRQDYGNDEIGQAGQALNTLQRAAIEAAVRQADMRRGVSEVFVNLARRNQVLLHRQLTLLDTMERRTEDAEELADLFRLDHLTTRMRRHAEGLVILSGAAASRQWRKPVQLMDVVRAAVAEVEDYERVEVRRLPRIGVAGPAVADLTHLIAELLENATVFSPPHTGVQVVGDRVANGFTLEIHDRGLGMAPEALLDANLRLAETPEFELSDTDRLGLFVVSRLAQRQNVRVSLQPSPYGGTTAVVFIPSTLLTDAPEADADSSGLRLEPAPENTGRRTGETALSALSGGRETRSANGGGRSAGPALVGAPAAPEAADHHRLAAVDPLTAAEPPALPAAVPLAPLHDQGLHDQGLHDRSRQQGQEYAYQDFAPDHGGGQYPRAQDPAAPGPAPDQGYTQELARDFGTGFGRSYEDSAPGRYAPDPDPSQGQVYGAPYEPPARDTDSGFAGLGRFPEYDDPDDEQGGVFRSRSLDRRRSAEERRRRAAADPAAERPAGTVPLPRRKPPTLVADNGRRLDTGTGPVPSAPVQTPELPAPAAGEPPATIGGLPRRVRQASLAPQLKKNSEQPPRSRTRTDDHLERDADQVRSRMASMQRGWQRGRLQNHADGAADDGRISGRGPGTGRPAPRNTSEGDGR
jgi:hypothetical protein